MIRCASFFLTHSLFFSRVCRRVARARFDSEKWGICVLLLFPLNFPLSRRHRDAYIRCGPFSSVAKSKTRLFACALFFAIFSLSLSPKRTLPSAEVGRSRRDMGEQERKALWISIDLGCCLESKVEFVAQKPRPLSQKRGKKKS